MTQPTISYPSKLYQGIKLLFFSITLTSGFGCMSIGVFKSVMHVLTFIYDDQDSGDFENIMPLLI